MILERYRSQNRSSAWNLLSLIAFASFGTRFVACGSSDSQSTGTTTAAVTNGTGYSPACEGGQRDGVCHPFTAQPETCECLDCSGTAYCKSLCVNDGKCDMKGGEDCTCIDCIKAQDCELGMDQGNQGPGPSTSPATVAASTSNTAAATNAATTAGQTSAAATTAGAGGSGSSSGTN